MRLRPRGEVATHHGGGDPGIDRGEEQGRGRAVGEPDHAPRRAGSTRGCSDEHVEAAGQVPEVLGQRSPPAHELVDQVGVAGVVVGRVPVRAARRSTAGPARAPRGRGGPARRRSPLRDELRGRARTPATCPGRARAPRAPRCPVRHGRRAPTGRPAPTWCPRCRRPGATACTPRRRTSSVTSTSSGTRVGHGYEQVLETSPEASAPGLQRSGVAVGKGVRLLGGHQPGHHLEPGREVRAGGVSGLHCRRRPTLPHPDAPSGRPCRSSHRP